MADPTHSDAKNPYLTIFENLRSPVAIVNRDRRIGTVNSSWKALFGEADAMADWIATEIASLADAKMQEAELEKWVDTAKGKRLLLVGIRRIANTGGGFDGWTIMLDDITRRHRAESALQETTTWFTRMFNAFEEAVFICTTRGLIVDANKAAQRIFGYAADELKDHSTELLHVDRERHEAFSARIGEALSEGDSASLEYVARRKNGEAFPAMANFTRIRRQDNKPLGIVSIVRDISAFKLAEEAARNSERLHGALELAGAVCHDLNQPLMAITGYAELILMDCPEDAPHFPKLKKIVDQVTKLGDITKRLMHVTRYETKTYMDQQIIDIEKASGG